MKKQIISFVLAVFLILSITACSAPTAADSTPAESAESAASATTTDAAATSEEPAVELNVAFPIFAPQPADLQLVQDEINKITLEKINATVKLVPIAGGPTYLQQLNLTLTGNEPLDLFITGNIPGFLDFSGQVAKNQLTDMTALLDQYGQGIKEGLGNYINTAKVNGKIFAVPTVKEQAQARGASFRVDYIEKYNIDLTKIKTIDDLEAVMKTVHEKEPEVYYGFTAGGTVVDTFGLANGGDPLGDSIGVLEDNQTLKVTNYFESARYAELVNKARAWYEAGYILPDAATNKLGNGELVKAGKIYGWSGTQNPAADTNDTTSAGTPIKGVAITTAIATTQSTGSWMWGIPSYTKNAEKAIQFLNLMYSDKEIINLLNYGIDGKHYVVNANGLAEYPEGMSIQNSGYVINMPFMFGNEFLSVIWQETDPDLWKKTDEWNKDGEASKAMGFLFDTTPVKTEYTAVANVCSQYQLSLETGSVDPAKVLPEFIAALKANGIDKIIAEKQKQLDAWAAANNVK